MVDWHPATTAPPKTRPAKALPLTLWRQSGSLNDQFRTNWDLWPETEKKIRQHSQNRKVAVLMVRGLFGHLMPGHFVKPNRKLKSLGLHSSIVATKLNGTITENVAIIKKAILAHADTYDEIYLLCHSKGGIEASLAVKECHPEPLKGIILVQSSRKASAVIESILQGKYRESRTLRSATKDLISRVFLHSTRLKNAATEITEPKFSTYAKHLPSEFPIKMFCVSSWSETPSTWVDSFHTRLSEINPDEHHDGQFFTKDMIWPGAFTLVLPEVDHAQPSVGGLGFDHAKFWTVLLHLLIEMEQ